MTSRTRFRVLLLGLGVACAVLLIGMRLYDLQVVRSERLRQRAADQHKSRVVVPALRGAIVDRNGLVLALSAETRSLYAHPARVADPARTAALLAPLLGQRRTSLLGELRSDRPFVYLARFLEPDVAEGVERLGLPLGGAEALGFENEPRRIYPRDQLAVHVVGFATIDGDGVEGIERVLDDKLKGDPRVYIVVKDARSRPSRQLVSEGRQKASDVVLSLDLVLQHLVERELDRAMRETRATAASAILLDPATGEVLALANRPAPDANQFGRASADARRNRAVVDRYEPGSTFKVVPLAAALEAGKIHPDRAIDCENGVWRTAGRVIHDVKPHGLLKPAEILTQSSNIGMVKLTTALTRSELADAIARFGFGERTGIELPGENAGLVRKTYEWSGFSQASLAFGQEIAVTAIQIAAAYGALANDGVLVPPRVILGTRAASGVLERLPAPEGRRVIRAETAHKVARMLQTVVFEGTGRRAAVPGYSVAGKSGTAQKTLAGGRGYSTTDYVASFAGFAPVDAPRLVLLVVIDSPHGDEYYGGEVAAPVFSRIMLDALRYLRVPADVPIEKPEEKDEAQQLLTSSRPRPAAHAAPAPLPDPAAALGKGLVPDVRGLDLRRAASVLASGGCGLRVEGSGVVIAQEPAPGAPFERGAVCSLVLGQPDEPAAKPSRRGST